MPKNTVNVPSDDYLAASVTWTLTNTLRGGTPAMRAAGKDYLPAYEREPPERYEVRLNRSVLTNLYAKTSDKLVGKPLKKDIELNEDVPADIANFAIDDIDKMGTSLMVFVKNVLESAVDHGVVHVLVDMPDAATIAQQQGEFVTQDENGDTRRALSLRQERELEIRPYARIVPATDLIGWKWELRQGKKVLTQIRIREIAKQNAADDEFQQIIRHRVRVFDETRWRLFEKSLDSEEWTVIEQGVNTLGKIPLVSFYTNKIEFMIGQPFLLDIAYLQVKHWQSSSDQQNILHVARVPILFGAGWGDGEKTQKELTVGASFGMLGPKGATLTYVEVTGAAIEAGEKDIKNIEQEIQLIGMELLVQRPTGNVTATARVMDQTEADSPMQMIVTELENAVGEVFDLFAEWLNLGEDGGGTVAIHKDFGITQGDASDIRELLSARNNGEISQTTLWKEMKRRNFLSDDFTPEDEISLLDVESNRSHNVKEDENEDIVNEAGDVTGTEDDHQHVLLANGITDTVNEHSHTWDEYGIRTSVDNGHSHGLIKRLTAGGKRGQQQTIEPETDDGVNPQNRGNGPQRNNGARE